MKALLYLMLLLLAGSTSPAFAKTPGEVEVGGTLRDVKMQGLAGPSGKLSAFLGKPLIINVWASWCGPCREEMASLERLSRRYGGQQFSVIGISTDDYPEAAEAFLKRSKIKFPQFIDSHLVLENMLGANRIPLTLLVNGQGQVLLKVYGTREWDDAHALALIGRTLRIKMKPADSLP
jgi:thiol-disulfide isomerase/thioredoxin